MNINTELEQAVQALREGQVILYPTDTVWGLGCDATNDEAVERLLNIKGRSDDKGLIVLVERDARLNRHVEEIPSIAWDLIDVTDEPLTIIYPKGVGLAKNVCAPDGSIAIRMTRDEFCSKLISKLNRPLVSTSANLSGNPTPKTFRQVDQHILEGVDYTVNLRQSETLSHRPSSIIKIDLNGEIKLVR